MIGSAFSICKNRAGLKHGRHTRPFAGGWISQILGSSNQNGAVNDRIADPRHFACITLDVEN